VERSGATAGGHARLAELATTELESCGAGQRIVVGTRRRSQLKSVVGGEEDPTTEVRNGEWSGARRPEHHAGPFSLGETCAHRRDKVREREQVGVVEQPGRKERRKIGAEAALDSRPWGRHRPEASLSSLVHMTLLRHLVHPPCV
jgi:hypothetical protein